MPVLRTLFSDEERTDGGLLVNGLDGAGQQRRDAQDHDAAAFLGFFRGGDGVGDHHLLDLRLANPLHGLAGKNRMSAAGIDGAGPLADQRLRGFHQRAGGVNDVVHHPPPPITCMTSVSSIPTRRLSTIASAESIFLAKKRARSTPPASGATTVRFGRLSWRKYSTRTGAASKWSTG